MFNTKFQRKLFGPLTYVQILNEIASIKESRIAQNSTDTYLQRSTHVQKCNTQKTMFHIAKSSNFFKLHKKRNEVIHSMIRHLNCFRRNIHYRSKFPTTNYVKKRTLYFRKQGNVLCEKHGSRFYSLFVEFYTSLNVKLYGAA